MNGKILLRTAGYITIGIGVYLVYKSGGFNIDINPRDLGNIIDAEFTVIDD